ISAAASADTTSLGLLGDPTPSDSTNVAAVVDVNLGLGNVTGAEADGTIADVAAAADINLGNVTGTGANGTIADLAAVAN
ncbi:hypothetical protein, partial [Escherichia coli]